ncbi:hypothetical protein [Microbacterium sp. A93]|uniref:hypothetical protein n=1 Tax=Microbacterium sp. A93 TaxID=3450716 RepID=UPI003F43F2CF
MQVLHTRSAVSSAFGGPDLVAATGLVPAMALAAETVLVRLVRLVRLVSEHLRLPGYFGANAGAKVSLTVRMDPAGEAAIAIVGDNAWETVKYTNAVFDVESSIWLSDAEVGEVPFPASRSRQKGERITGRLVARRIHELSPKDLEQPTPFDTRRAFFTTVDAAVMALNLTRAGGTLAGGTFAKAESATFRAKLINVPARSSRYRRHQEPSSGTPGQ